MIFGKPTMKVTDIRVIRVIRSFKIKRLVLLLSVNIAGFVWFQGLNDKVNRNVYPVLSKESTENRFTQYSQWLADFIRDVRKDVDAPHMPFVIGVMGVGGVREEDFLMYGG